MRVDYHRRFKKEHKKLQPKIKVAFQERLRIFFVEHGELVKFLRINTHHELYGK